LWDISKLFLKSPWRWPQLWGMNMTQIRNPHLIYPGQVLVLVKSGDRAMLQIGAAQPSAEPPSNTVKLSPRVRSQLLDNGAIATIPLNQIGPFLNEAVVFETADLRRRRASSPRRKAASWCRAARRPTCAATSAARVTSASSGARHRWWIR
jgi:hypothetical protein